MTIVFEVAVHCTPEREDAQTFARVVAALQADMQRMIDGNQVIGLPPRDTRVRFVVKGMQ